MNREHLWIRFGVLLLILLAALAVLWCMGHPRFIPESKPAMYIEPAQDRALRNESFQQSYDFRTDGNLQSVLMEIWELQDGQWALFGGGSIAADTQEGQFVLAFNELSESVTYSIRSTNYTYSIGKNFISNAYATAGNMLYTTMQTQLKEIIYETPIPIAMQIYTPNRHLEFIGTDFFFQPDKLAAEGHDHVIAVTLTFSEQPME